VDYDRNVCQNRVAAGFRAILSDLKNAKPSKGGEILSEPYPMNGMHLSIQEIARLGDAIYSQLRSSLEPANNGRVVAIDVLSGLHVLADRAIEASRELQAHAGVDPENIWLVKVGDRAFCRSGAGNH
jgi:hypothetical protein